MVVIVVIRPILVRNLVVIFAVQLSLSAYVRWGADRQDESSYCCCHYYPTDKFLHNPYRLKTGANVQAVELWRNPDFLSMFVLVENTPF